MDLFDKHDYGINEITMIPVLQDALQNRVMVILFITIHGLPAEYLVQFIVQYCLLFGNRPIVILRIFKGTACAVGSKFNMAAAAVFEVEIILPGFIDEVETRQLCSYIGR